MSPSEQRKILAQLVQMRPDLDNPDDDEEAVFRRQYEACYEVYHTLPGDPDDWVLVEMLDAETFEPKWFWRRKS